MSDTKKNRKKVNEVEVSPQIEENDLGTFEPGFFISEASGNTWNEEYDYKVGVHSSNGIIPKFATSGSSCFDFVANFGDRAVLDSYSPKNNKIWHRVRKNSDGVNQVILEPGDRVLIPTGLWFDLPEQTELLIFARSGLSLKKGLALANGVGVVDSDYVEEVFVILVNNSRSSVVVEEGERIAQGRISYTTKIVLSSMSEKPRQKTERNGGFGSTGV